MKTINLTPTWAALIPVLVEVAANGSTPEGRNEAMSELLRLARTVDAMNAETREARANTTNTANDAARFADRGALMDAMQRLVNGDGGGFAQKLSAAWFHADSDNKRRIEGAFSDLIKRHL